MKRNYCTVIAVISVMILFATATLGKNNSHKNGTTSVASYAKTKTTKLAQFDQLADQIIAGAISEEQFNRMNLDEKQTFEVFKRISDKRGYGINDEVLSEGIHRLKSPPMAMKATVAVTTVMVAAVAWKYNQPLELESGSNEAAYPVGSVAPNRNNDECGSKGWTDRLAPDTVLLYNNVRWRNSNPDNLRIWTDMWWLRQMIKIAYPSGMAASGLDQPTIRLCAGLWARAGGRALWPMVLGSDLRYLYIWRKP